MTYESLASFAQTWGMVYIVGIFAIAVAYALAPKNRAKFERAARSPLDEDELNG